ncbi:unnamed protein product, partial [Didymodactylos carnosus]
YVDEYTLWWVVEESNSTELIFDFVFFLFEDEEYRVSSTDKNGYDDERTIDEEEQKQQMSAEEIQIELAELQADSFDDESSLSSSCSTSESSPHNIEYEQLLNNSKDECTEESDEEQNDPSYTIESEKLINIGEEYQAVVPDTVALNENDLVKDQSQLLWTPCANELSLDQYLSLSTAECPTADQEISLEIFMNCNYNTEQALEKLKNTSKKNIYPLISWPLEECDLFEQSLKEFGKDFYKIHLYRLPNHSVHELVCFYYTWKKTDRLNEFIQSNQVEKQRRFHITCSEIFEKFLDEQEQQVFASCEHQQLIATCSSSLLSTDIKRRSPLPTSCSSSIIIPQQQTAEKRSYEEYHYQQETTKRVCTENDQITKKLPVVSEYEQPEVTL